MKKRLFAGLLSLLMLWTMLPVSALAVGDETIENQDAYFYVLKPEEIDNKVTTATADFDYMGRGTICAPDPKVLYGVKYDIPYDVWSFEPPKDGELKIAQLTLNGVTYQYTSEDTFVSGTDPQFRIEWYRYSSARGATGVNNEEIVSSNQDCWHIDGYPVFSENYAINFEVKMPGSDEFSLYPVDETPYIQYITKGDDAIVASVVEPTPNDTITENSVKYVFDGWYIDEDCTEKADENQDTPLAELAGDDNQITFYGKYVPDTKVYVYADASNLNDNTETYLTEVLGFEIVGGYFPLGVLNNVEIPAADTKGLVPANYKDEVATAAKTESNFVFDEDGQNYEITKNYNEIQQNKAREWLADYVEYPDIGKLTVVGSGAGGFVDDGYTWHLDIKLTDDILPTVTVTPADITIYMGGKDGHDGVVDASGNIVSNNTSLPEPGFTVELPEGVTANVTDLTFKEKDNSSGKKWTLKPYDGQTGTNVYKLVPGSGQEATRVQFTKADGTVIVSDEFEVGANVNQTLTMQLYKGSGDTQVGEITVEVGGVHYDVDSSATGTLTVRGTTEDVSVTSVSTAAPTDGAPGAVADSNTTYTINDSEIKVTDGDVSLLFDEIIDISGDDRTELLWKKAQEAVTGLGENSKYEFKYLDLVDANNGNAWVKASQNVTVYWPLPEGTSKDTQFTLLHFKGLHREMASENIGSAINNCDVEKVNSIVVTDTHVQFQIGSGGFSPFVLVWGEATTPDPDPEPDPDPDPDPDPHPGGSTTIYYTLEYESNGGTEYDDERYVRNTVVDLDKVPTREGYTFTGWYADEELTERITEIKMTSDKTVYAGWEATGVPDWLNGDDHFAYVIGYPDGMVKPQNNISRAEVATIFFRLLKPEIRDKYLTQTNQFTDVSGSAWYNTAVSTMAALDIAKGRTPTTFVPDAPITRAEFAAVCARFDTHLRDGDSDFSDISGHWAEAEIERAATLGWINGYPDGTFRPDNAITRAEAMTMINRVLQRLPENEDDLLPDMNVWPDNQPQDWYYLAVQEATNSHDFDRKDDGVHEHWTDMNADPNWTQYQ